MKLCNACKSENIKEIEIVTRGAFTAIEVSNGISLNPKSSKINKYVCLDCGCINLYAKDFQKFK